MFNWLSRFLGSSGTRGPSDDFWYTPIAGISSAGEPVNANSALKVPAVRACLQCLSDAIASLPLHIFRRPSADQKQRADGHPIADLLRYQPNEEQTAAEFYGFMQWQLSLHGNAIAEILPGPRGAIDQLVPVDWQYVSVRRDQNRVRWYELRVPGTPVRMANEVDIWHLRAAPLCDDGLSGRSPLFDAQDTIGQALAVQNYGARFFRNDGQAGGILKHPGQFKDNTLKEQFLRAWRAARTGKNQHRDAVLEFGIDYVPHAINNEHAQFLETRKEMAVEVARIWRVPPHKIGILDRATFSNIEQQALEFITDTLLPWLTIWEQAIRRDLIIAKDTFFAEFNVTGLLRGDSKSRFEAYALGRQWGWLSVNDIRTIENMNPVPGGDRRLEPLNMQPLGTEAEGSIEIHSTIPAADKARHLRIIQGGKAA